MSDYFVDSQSWRRITSPELPSSAGVWEGWRGRGGGQVSLPFEIGRIPGTVRVGRGGQLISFIAEGEFTMPQLVGVLVLETKESYQI